MENDFTSDEVIADTYREYFTEEYTVISTEACYGHCQQGGSFITLKVLIRTRGLDSFTHPEDLLTFDLCDLWREKSNSCSDNKICVRLFRSHSTASKRKDSTVTCIITLHQYKAGLQHDDNKKERLLRSIQLCS